MARRTGRQQAPRELINILGHGTSSEVRRAQGFNQLNYLHRIGALFTNTRAHDARQRTPAARRRRPIVQREPNQLGRRRRLLEATIAAEAPPLPQTPLPVLASVAGHGVPYNSFGPGVVPRASFRRVEERSYE